MGVLVTGGAGYIGSHLVWELLEAGEDVVVIDRLSTGFDWAVAPQAKLVVGDIGDLELVRSLIRTHDIDAIFHFAGSVVVPESVEKPLAYYDNNTARTRGLIEVAVETGVRNFVFSSTAAVYGSVGAEPVTEAAQPQPESPYGLSKLMSEWMLRDAAAAHDFNYVALRYFNVAGGDPQGRTGQSTRGATHLIKVATETALGKRPFMNIFGTDYPTPDGTCVRDYIHVTDLAVAHRLALSHLRDGNGSLVANCGYGRGFSVREVIDSVRRQNGGDFEVRETARRPGDAAAVVANSQLLQTRFGWAPKYDDLDTIVSHALSWERGLDERLAAAGR